MMIPKSNHLYPPLSKYGVSRKLFFFEDITYVYYKRVAISVEGRPTADTRSNISVEQINKIENTQAYAMNGPKNARSLYLVTYSQADVTKVPSREAFANIVVEAFNATGKTMNQILQWVCCQELHDDGNPHYHMALKLKLQRRWNVARKHILDNHDVNVNFSDTHSNYYDAYQYCVKQDIGVIKSPDHPVLNNPPRTAGASNSTHTTAQNQNSSKKRKRSFDALDLSNIIVQNNIKCKTELLHFAKVQKDSGKTDLAIYILNNTQKAMRLIETSWDMENASKLIQRTSRNRVEILSGKLNDPCTANCDGQWLQYARETLQKNNISNPEFAKAMKQLLQKDRSKHTNIL